MCLLEVDIVLLLSRPVSSSSTAFIHGKNDRCQDDAAALRAQRLTDNELAKNHIRYLGGGRAGRAIEECVYRFEFPERTGALLRFMRKLPVSWNITLVHYRNHGTAWASTLIGFEVPVDERGAVQTVLSGCGARFWNETDNTAFGVFVKTHPSPDDDQSVN